jgi:hypothetical protein
MVWLMLFRENSLKLRNRRSVTLIGVQYQEIAGFNREEV